MPSEPHIARDTDSGLMASRLQLDQLRAYAANHRCDGVLSPPMALLVGALASYWVPGTQATLWSLTTLLVTLLNATLCLQFLRRERQPAELPRWLWAFSLAHGTHVLVWASPMIWGWQSGDLTNQMFLILVQVGLISATNAMSHPHPRLYLVDQLPVMAILLIRPLFEGSVLYLMFSALGLLFCALLLYVGLQMQRSISDMFRLRAENEQLIERLRHLAATDALTGLPNRRHFLELGRDLIRAARERRRPLALLMLDVDRFKQVNDTYGHAGGDLALQALVQPLRTATRAGDLLGRLGGEEFVVLLPDSDPAQAFAIAERLRQAIAGQRIEADGSGFGITVSIGVATLCAECELGDARETLELMMARADRMLYVAKRSGRDRVEQEAM